jgi:hypothetical protein
LRDNGGRLESFVAVARSIAPTETGHPTRLLRLARRFVSSEFDRGDAGLDQAISARFIVAAKV